MRHGRGEQMSLPKDYLERTYAGVLGKVIGVYMGRPFEGATYDRIVRDIGPIWYYVNEKLGHPLIVTDDDITGTFTFIRALDDYDLDFSAGDAWSEKVGKTWLNYLINRKTILWWGGIGMSSEHTAYARLAAGIPAPRSGSIELNGKIIGEQIGAQIFIDGWGMVAPGDPERAAWLAGQAGRVSHDGESVYAAQVVAAMEAEAGLSQVPKDAIIRRMAEDLYEQRSKSDRWEEGYRLLHRAYGYDKYRGACHVVPNHGLILMTLMYAPDSFQKAMMIVNTSGWDTDCNSANVGCIMGIHLGLDGFEGGPDYRGPVRDQVYLPTADGGSCMSDAAREAYKMANRGRKLAGEPALAPKAGARYHFELPGATQGFRALEGSDWTKNVSIANTAGHSSLGERSLRVDFGGAGLGQGVAVATETFVPAEVFEAPGYEITACPILYPGQTVTARVELGDDRTGTLAFRLIAPTYNTKGEMVWLRSETTSVQCGGEAMLSWTIPETGGYPILKIGVEARAIGDEDAGKMTPFSSSLDPHVPYPNEGTFFVDYLRIDGTPTLELGPPAGERHESWGRQWVNACTAVETWSDGQVRPVQDAGTGLYYTGDRTWSGYRIRAQLTPSFFSEAGIAVYVQGMKHYLAAVVRSDGTAALVEMWDEPTDLATASFPSGIAWETPMDFEVWVEGRTLHAKVGSQELSGEIRNSRLDSGGAGIVVTEGTLKVTKIAVSPVG